MKNLAKFYLAFALLFLISKSISAQTPGGVRAGLRLWLKADAGTTASGSTVTGWNDQSGNGLNMTQGSYTGPTLTSGALNYNPGLSFTTNLLYRTTGIFSNGTTYNNLNYYCVYNSNNQTTFHWLCHEGPGYNGGLTRFSQSMNYSGTTEGDMDATTTNRLSYVTTINMPLIVSYLNSSTAITGSSKELLYLNGQSIASSTSYTPFVGPVADTFQIGENEFDFNFSSQKDDSGISFYRIYT